MTWSPGSPVGCAVMSRLLDSPQPRSWASTTMAWMNAVQMPGQGWPGLTYASTHLDSRPLCLRSGTLGMASTWPRHQPAMSNAFWFATKLCERHSLMQRLTMLPSGGLTSALYHTEKQTWSVTEGCAYCQSEAALNVISMCDTSSLVL